MSDKILFPRETVLVTDHFDIHQDREIPIPGFLVMATTRKIASICEFNTQEIEEFLPLLVKVRGALKEVLHINNVYFFQNEDSTHGFHVWIFPRHPWMERFGRKIQSVRPIMEYAKESMGDGNTIKEIKEAIKKLKEYLIKRQD